MSGGFIAALACPWLVWVGLPLVLWRTTLSPTGRSVLKRLLPGKWAARRITTAYLFGPPLVAAVVRGTTASAGEGVVVFVLDLIELSLVGGVLVSSGLIRGRVDWTTTTKSPPPNPWRLLSFRDRFRIRRCVRTGLLPHDDRFVVDARAWVASVLTKPEYASPGQQQRAAALNRLLHVEAGAVRTKSQAVPDVSTP